MSRRRFFSDKFRKHMTAKGTTMDIFANGLTNCKVGLMPRIRCCRQEAWSATTTSPRRYMVPEASLMSDLAKTELSFRPEVHASHGIVTTKRQEPMQSQPRGPHMPEMITDIGALPI
jgi:hypothetical protein